jgi:hypothetical protein
MPHSRLVNSRAIQTQCGVQYLSVNSVNSVSSGITYAASCVLSHSRYSKRGFAIGIGGFDVHDESSNKLMLKASG